jgi:pimeloyl-ACP methyl ester carboxylesterase
MSRHFVRIGDRLVHYRRWGTGPAVLLLHGSPQSSRAVEAMAQILVGQGLSAIAPDTPGNGLSAPLPGQPDCADYARALAGFADALGLGRVGLYGFHTGANIGCAFAVLYPERVSAIVFNGFSAWTEAESAELPSRYLPRFEPVWDGSHMTWVWSRLEEHCVFFPWYDRRPAARMTYDVPPPQATQASVLDFLDSGDNYRAPYAAAFRFRTEDWLHRVTAPYLLASTAIDPLCPHFKRPPLKLASPQIFADPPALYQVAAHYLASHPGTDAPPPVESGERGLINGIAWYGRREGSGRPVILLHEAGGSSRRFRPILSDIAFTRPVVALDLPGHGESEKGAAEDSGIDHFAAGIGKAIAGLGFDRPAVVGYGFGALVAGRLAATGVAFAAGRLGANLPTPADPVSLAAPSLTPEWDGAHLLRAFRIARWERLFAPWYRRDRAHAIEQGDIDPASVHARAVELIKANGSWTAAVECERNSPEHSGVPPLSRSEDAADWRQGLIDFSG